MAHVRLQGHALQCLPVFFSACVDKHRAAGGADNDYLIAVATSGDTGKAALQGFADRDHISIVVFYPDGGVSDIQFKQMATQEGDNVCVYGVRGNFDDCQTSVKRMFDDATFNAHLLDTRNIALSSANSINWGRLLPQVVYYISAYSMMVKDGVVAAGDPIDVTVPTGNFGNILACWYAKQLGVPIDRIVCASNANRVLADFIETGVYDISDRPFMLTPSPSMDILVSSNLERQLFELTGRDAAAIQGWMDDLREKRRFEALTRRPSPRSSRITARVQSTVTRACRPFMTSSSNMTTCSIRTRLSRGRSPNSKRATIPCSLPRRPTGRSSAATCIGA